MKLMQVWVVCVLAFFGMAELYQWLHGITLPMPVFVIAGALLAVASNANKVWPKSLEVPAVPPSSAPVSPIAPPEPVLPPRIAPPSQPSIPQLPTLTPIETPSISFTIQRSPQGQASKGVNPQEGDLLP
jgi:hypothetical protein